MRPIAHPAEPHQSAMAPRLNWLRAGVLGANDGIVSTAGLVVGVAGATTERGPIFTAGLAGLVAGAISMGLGEYISSAANGTASGHSSRRSNVSWPRSLSRNWMS